MAGYETAADLIREIGIGRLGGFDGCKCTSFAVRGVEVEVGCRKSSGMDSVFPDFFGIGLRITSGHMDNGPDELQAVAREVVEQLRDEGYAIKVRYSTYKQDKDATCLYCGADRPTDEYLCSKCKVGVSPFGGPIAQSYAFTFHGVDEPDQ